MNRFALTAAFAALAAIALAEGQVTIVNSRNKTDFKRYSLQVNPFEFKAGQPRTDSDVLRICESLDNSRLAILGHGGEKCFAETTRFLFGTPAVATSLDGFFRRGGMLYVEPGSWGVYNSWADEARRFFADRGVVVPTGGDYKDPNSGKGDRVVVGRLQDGPGKKVFGGPNAPERLCAVRYFDGAATASAKAYVATDAGEVLMMGKKVEKGAVVFSLVISVMDRASSPFWDNCVEALYGKSAAQKHAGRSVYIASARRRGLKGLYVREVPVFARMTADTPPPDGAPELSGISMLLARGDRELARIAFYNCTDESYVFRLEPSPDRRNRDIFTFLDVVPWRSPAGQVQHEIVSTLGSAGTVCVPSGETKTILLAAETDRPAGKYEWSFEIVPVNADIPTRRVSVSAEVLDLAIDRECLPVGYLFGPYNTGAAVGRIGAYRSFLVDRNRVTHVSAGVSPWGKLLAKGPDGSVRIDEKAVIPVSDEVSEKAQGRKWVCSYGQLYSFRVAMKKLGAPAGLADPQALKLFRRGVARIDAAYRAAGIDPGADFFESLIDEPNAKDIPDVLAAAEVVHSLGWRVCLDIATWCTLDDVRRLAPAVDWWQPWERRLENRATSEEEAAFYRSTGKRVTPYLCSMSGNTDPYLGYHRFRGIRAFWRGYDGFCTWAANSWRGNDYRGRDNDLDGSKGSFPGSWYIHHGDDAPVGTMRLEAWREGAEDFHWLKVAEKLGAAEEFRSAERLRALDATSDPAAVKAWRDGLLRGIAAPR